MQPLKAERYVENSKTNVENKNPHPCAECGIGNDHGRLQHRLRAARMGVGSFLRPVRKRKVVKDEYHIHKPRVSLWFSKCH